MALRIGSRGKGLVRAIGVAGALLAVTLVGTGAASAAPDAAIVVDAKTGKTLYASNADATRHPASLTKMMTLYLLFEAIDSGRTRLDSRIKISARAAGQAPTKLGLKPGATISVRDAILSQVTKSANDISVAIAEHVAGSESAFIKRMNAKARALGMAHTTFRNANGLPDSRQVSSARDMALLGRALQDHYPQHFSYFSTPSFVYGGRRMSNHNRLLGKVKGVDGIKTGYTRASGYNLVTSVNRGDRSVVAVVMGGETGSWRDKHMAELIEKYLPKASRGPRTAPLVAGFGRAGGTARVALDDHPLPRLRPNGQSNAFATASVASLVGANSAFALDAAGQGDAAADDDAPISTPPAVIAGAWKIQIAATPTRSSAEQLLDRALGSGGQVLASATPYTEPVDVKGTTLYRARFGGFPDKDSARAACAHLQKRDFDCLALSD